jgi:hypothetical protein
MPSGKFEPAILAIKRLQTCALVCEATSVGLNCLVLLINQLIFYYIICSIKLIRLLSIVELTMSLLTLYKLGYLQVMCLIVMSDFNET